MTTVHPFSSGSYPPHFTIPINVPPTPDLVLRSTLGTTSPSLTTVTVLVSLMANDPLASKLRETLQSVHGFTIPSDYEPKIAWVSDTSRYSISIVLKKDCSLLNIAPKMTEAEWKRGEFHVEWLQRPEPQEQKQWFPKLPQDKSWFSRNNQPVTPVANDSNRTGYPTFSNFPFATAGSTSNHACSIAPGPKNLEEVRFGKPIIYLFPPKSEDGSSNSKYNTIDVSIQLCSEWDFSAVYPVVPVTTSDRSTTAIKWNVKASPNGDLEELSTGLKTSSLFWEAIPSPSIPAALAPLSNISFTSANSICLPFLPLLAYLDKTLTALSLHVNARTEFITFWLPSFIRLHEEGKDIVIQFMDQKWCEARAELKVKPEAEVVTRVYMLFRGVDDEEKNKVGWGETDTQEIDWKQIVGVKSEAWREDKFRVLEWGAAEVHLTV